MIATRLDILRSQLANLRVARQGARQMSAWSVVATALLWSLVAVFLIDWFFQREMQAPQRVVLLLLAIGVVVWVYRKFAEPLLKVRESDVDMALMVERQQQIDTDLVAAIQFEGDVEGRWGSRQLETAVIDYVAQLGKGIDVFQGFNRDEMNRRLMIAGGTLAVCLFAAAIFPGYFFAFVNRMCLGSQHYPSATQISHLALNGHSVLTRGMKPDNVRLAEGRGIEFLVRCERTLPADGVVRLSSTTDSQRSEVELKALTLDERLARLRSADRMLTVAQQSPGLDLAGPWFEEFASSVRYELPGMWKTLELDGSMKASELGKTLQARLPELRTAVSGAISAWPGEAAQSALLTGELPRLTDPVAYRLSLGDAYTDPAQIAMIALPTVEAQLTPIPPKYAAAALSAETSGRQASVLAGSKVDLAIECTNKKPLKEAWLIVRSATETATQRFDLVPQDQNRLKWKLADAKSPFVQVKEELRYEIQVTDDDGLHLETPIKGSVRIRVDKPPVAIASTVHRVVLPAARPTIQYRVGDDFGIKRLELEVQIERLEAASKSISSNTAEGSSEVAPATGTAEGGKEVKAETALLDLLGGKGSIPLKRLPLAGKAPLPLEDLKFSPPLKTALVKGDRLKVVLLAEDDRGDLPGETFRSEPIIIEISDEFGVATAVGEADPQAEQRVTELIKRQLGIGEAP